MSEFMKFSAPSSVVDSSFFQKLSELKLNNYKLDTSSKEIYGSFRYSSLGRDQSSILSLNDVSFQSREDYKLTL